MSGLIARAAIETPRHQPAAADRNDDRVEIGRVLEHFQRHRARAGDDLRIVERVNEDVAVLERELAGLGVSIVEHVAVKDDLGAVAGGLRHLHRRRRRRHDDRRRNAEPLGMIGDRLRVIAGRRRDHAARALLGRQLQQFVERAALLVGGGELQILELQPDFGADDFGQGPADQHRRADDRALDALRGGADVVDRRGLQASARGLALHRRANNAKPPAMNKHLLALAAALLAIRRRRPTR